LPRKAQPLGTVYQPEVAAEAVLYAAHHRRREIYVGFPTVKAIVGNKIMPGYGDHYLARVAYEGQQYDGLADPNRPNNLWEPVDDAKDHGAHGDFDSRAHYHSLQLWTDLHRDLALLTGAGVAGALLATLVGKQGAEAAVNPLSSQTSAARTTKHTTAGNTVPGSRQPAS
jgi:hypothetical protein